MATRLILPGKVVAAAIEPGLEKFLQVELLRAHSVEVTARGAAAEEHDLEGAQDTDVMELEFETGVKQWVSVAQLRADLGQSAPRLVADERELRVPAMWPEEGTGRGLSDLVLKGLKVLRISPAEAVAQKTAREIVEHFEGQLEPGPGLLPLA
jgi:hypothetical protein